jgi:hypothetical protein
MPRRYFTLFLALTLLLAMLDLGACQFQRKPSEGHAFILTLIDHTKSMKDFGPQQVRDIAKIIASLNGGDMLQIYPINENPLSSPEPIIVKLTPYDPNRFNPVMYRRYIEKELARQAAEALAQVKARIFAQDLASDTALIDSLELAARAFRSPEARTATHRRLVFLSDMWEDQRGKLRLPHENLTPKRVEMLLGKVTAGNRLPNLAGIDVWVAGARIHRDSPRDLEDGVEAFWMGAFARMGAVTYTERFAPSLREFPTNEIMAEQLIGGRLSR